MNSNYTKPFSFELKPITLESDHLKLEPLTANHIEDLVKLFEPGIWQWYTHQIKDQGALRTFLNGILDEQNQHRTLAFAIREKAEGKLVGSTRFMNLFPSHRRIEIGSTWYAPKWQRTFVNTEAKLLLLTHAFENLQCISVQLQTDALNARSRAAIERLGAKLDGSYVMTAFVRTDEFAIAPTTLSPRRNGRA
jgi:RimJ/RimL family protein N-acetyltransferase